MNTERNGLQLVISCEGLMKEEKINLLNRIFIDRPNSDFTKYIKSTYSKYLSAYYGTAIFKELRDFNILEYVCFEDSQDAFIRIVLPKKKTLAKVSSKIFLKKLKHFLCKIYPVFEIYIESVIYDFSEVKSSENYILNMLALSVKELPYNDLQFYTKTQLNEEFLNSLETKIYKELSKTMFNTTPSILLECKYGTYLSTKLQYQFNCKVIDKSHDFHNVKEKQLEEIY